jgi:D-alanyl-D-alanine carboxypeptidase (penicillin-binding protein 5/6)
MAEHIAGSEEAFVESMNRRAEALGMQDTHFVNCTGLDDGEDAKAHLTSAYDIALMSRELMKNHPDIQKFTTIWMDTVRNGEFGLSNTNKLVRFYPGATGLKTGFTSNAGYCLSATAQRNGLGLVAVVMGCETSQDRFGACKQLLDYGFANYALVSPEIQVPTVPVKLGTADSVRVVPNEPVQLLVDKAQANQVQIHTELEEQVAAPVSKGQRLGTLTVKVGEQTVTQIPMVAEAAVPRLTWWDIFCMVFGRFAMAKG